MDVFVDSIWQGNHFCETIRAARENAIITNNNITTTNANNTAANSSTNNNSSSAAFLPRTTSIAAAPAAVVPVEEKKMDPPLPVVLHIHFGCHELFLKSKFGSGNFIQAIYMMRQAAQQLGNIDIRMSCHDAVAAQADLLLPWFTGRWRSTQFPPPTTAPASAAATIMAARLAEAAIIPLPFRNFCGPFYLTPLTHFYREMQYDVRKMTISLVGIIPNHASEQFAEEVLWGDTIDSENVDRGATTKALNVPQLPIPSRNDDALFPDVVLDDAVIHFRCGDLLSTELSNYGFMTFAGYTRHISPAARSIGILTQPFGDGIEVQQRWQDTGAALRQRCRTLVLSLVDYIHHRIPLAVVRVHNDPEESIALAYARMVMANQTVAAMSTFGVFPIIGTFGTGYFLRPGKWSPNVWLLHPPIVTLTNNVVLFDESNIMVGAATKTLWDSGGDQAVLDWFWKETEYAARF